jgi:hypothetical protein
MNAESRLLIGDCVTLLLSLLAQSLLQQNQELEAQLGVGMLGVQLQRSRENAARTGVPPQHVAQQESIVRERFHMRCISVEAAAFAECK